MNATTLSPQSADFDQEQVVMDIIVNAGEARSLCFEAMRLARSGDYSQAKARLLSAKACINKAHLTQTQLIELDQGEGKVAMTLVMVHAQDHLMTTILAQELACEMIEIHAQLATLIPSSKQ